MKNINIQSDNTKEYKSFIHNEKYLRNILLTTCDTITKYIEQSLFVSKDTTFLEVGFNDGLLLKNMQKRYPASKFVGIEVRTSCVDNMVQQGFDCRQVSDEIFFIDKKFDIIYGSAVLHHISRPYEYIRHLYSLLNPKGIIIFTNEAHIYDLVSILYATVTRTWKYEKNIFKLSKKKIQQTLQTLTSKFYIEYIPPIFLSGLGPNIYIYITSYF